MLARTKPISQVAVNSTMTHTDKLNCRRDRGGDDDGDYADDEHEAGN